MIPYIRRSRLHAPLVSIALVSASLAACGGDATSDFGTADRPGRAAAPPVATGTLEGRVTLAGSAPELAPFTITANADVCGAAATSNLLMLGDENAIAGAVVWIAGDDARPADPQTMDQVGCQYSPHVVAAPVGSVIRFTNSDPAPHNVRVEELESGKVLLNVAQPSQGKVDEWTIPAAGAYLVGCDYHPWMNAYVVGTGSAHVAVTGPDGRYSIAGAPAGEHDVVVWHNGVGAREKRDNRGNLIRYGFSAPVTVTQRVRIAKDSTSRIDAALDLASAPTTNATP